jgi:hypothetical protein
VANVSRLGDAALHAHMMLTWYEHEPGEAAFQIPDLPVALQRRMVGLRQIIWGIFG